jgi:hypothetical protein
MTSGHDHPTPSEKADELAQLDIEAVECELIGGAVVVMGEIDAIPAALSRMPRLPVVDLDERVGAEEVRAGVESRYLGRIERQRYVRVAIVLPRPESRFQVLGPAADEKVSQWSDAGSPAEVLRADRVVGSILPTRIRSETKEVVLG